MLVKAADEGISSIPPCVNGFWASIGPAVSHTPPIVLAKFAVKGFTEALIN